MKLMTKSISDMKPLTVREMIIVGVAVAGFFVNNAVRDAKNDARFDAIEKSIVSLSENLAKDINVRDVTIRTLQLSVQELRTSLQQTQLELAELKGSRKR